MCLFTIYYMQVLVKKGNKTLTMALMHDYVRRANFTTKPRLRGIFSAFALFVRGYSFKFTALGHSFMQNFSTLQFKTRLGGEICSLDVNMHKGYSIFKW